MSPSPIRKTLLLTLFIVSAFLLTASAASAKVLWTADAERDTYKEWANNSCQNDSRVRQISSLVAQGNRAYEVEVRDGDDSWGERCELGEGNPTRDGFPLYNEGDERWISFQVRLPDDYPIDAKSWNVIMQLKQLGGIGTPAVSMEVQDGKWSLENSDTNHESSGCNWWWTGPAQRNVWTKFTLHVKFSPRDDVGYIELFGDLDGQGVKKLMDKTYMHTMKVENGHTVQSHSRIGLYRDPKIQGTSHIYFDGYTMGDDRTSVEAHAFGAAGGSADPAPDATTPKPPSTNQGGKSRPNPTPAPRKRGKKRRVWLRRERGIFGASVSPWSRIISVYGGVRSKSHKRRAVTIQIRRHHRWVWLSRGWLRSNGRFYLAPAVDLKSGTVVRLRAVVKGMGRSNTLKVRVR
jgi:hypothetical protein